MKYVPGLMAGQLSGSVGSQTASRNAFGSYFRQRVNPVQPRTPAQTSIRALFTALATQWRDLTEAQRTAWGILGGQMQRLDPLGQTYNLSGFQAFISVNLRRLVAGQATVDDAPTFQDVPELEITAAAYSLAGTFTVTFTGTLGLGTPVKVFATEWVSQGRNFFGPSEYRLIGVFSGPVSPLDITTEYQTRFPGAIVGTKVGVKLVTEADNFTDRHETTAVVTVAT